jgi:hypothetical protein
VDGARMVAKFFLDLGDHASAIQFLVLSNQNSEVGACEILFFITKKLHGAHRRFG